MSDNSPNPAEQLPPGVSNAPFNAAPGQFPVPTPPAYLVAQASGMAGMVPTVSVTRGMYTAAAIINWVVLGIVIVATVGIGIIAAAWFIPMTILIHRGAKGPYRHTGLAVCTLLFCNIISGILMLVDDSNRPAKPVS
jgi:hypothetical protein